MTSSYLKGLDRDVLDYLEGAPSEFLKCRMRGHDWDLLHDGYIVQEEGVHAGCLTEHMQCSRCQSSCVDTFDSATLERVCSREYSYTDGYLQQGLAVPRVVVRRYRAQEAKVLKMRPGSAQKIATRKPRKTPATRAA
ncbi:hypothetical protein [Amycolatopsis sp. SB7-3]|uniref:hypothetical protein n=1 Tax=Amycolatopsis sp. SB7-3 TaxID=3373438 RepID=UPI003743CD0C